MIEPAQIRAARALLGWRHEDLWTASGVGAATFDALKVPTVVQRPTFPRFRVFKRRLKLRASFLLTTTESRGPGFVLLRQKRRESDDNA